MDAASALTAWTLAVAEGHAPDLFLHDGERRQWQPLAPLVADVLAQLRAAKEKGEQ